MTCGMLTTRGWRQNKGEKLLNDPQPVVCLSKAERLYEGILSGPRYLVKNMGTTVH